jgi:hypothetical protein
LAARAPRREGDGRELALKRDAQIGYNSAIQVQAGTRKRLA